MALVQYISKMDVFIQKTNPDGTSSGAQVYLGDIYSVKINTKSNDNPVATFGGAKGKGGIAGYSDGYIETEITFDKAVPRAGDNFDILQTMIDHATVILYGKVGGKRRKYEGRIMTKGEDFGLNKASADSVSIHCGEPEVVNQ